MSLRIEAIHAADLTRQERESILAHAIDLHLVGSDEADSVGFDLVEKRSTAVAYLLRVVDGSEHVGVAYVMPAVGHPTLLEMTVLVHEAFRGRHYAGSMIELVEQYLRNASREKIFLGAAVHEHVPMRQQLTGLLLRHGFSYSSQHGMFVKQI